jgi:hypothetical protein
MGIRCADHATPTSGGRSVGIVRLRTKTTEFFLFGVRLSPLGTAVTLWTIVPVPDYR